MFGLFKKRIHEPEEAQRAELREREPIAPLALAGEDCDQLSAATGPFGHSFNNPIPVNGLLGTFKYFVKLKANDGSAMYFHRLGSVRSSATANSVDAYEVVKFTGSGWDILFVDMYHPRRSNLCPEGYQLTPYNKQIGDIPFAFGVNVYCPNFPLDLPDAIERLNGTPAFARKVRERVATHDFSRPPEQQGRLLMVQNVLVSRKT